MMFVATQEWRDDVLSTVKMRFENRLSQELSAVRVEITKELAAMRVESLRWAFAFWITQLGAMAGLLAYLR